MLLCDIGNTSYHFLEGEKDYKKEVLSFNPETIRERVFYICVNQEVSKLLEPLENWINLSQYIVINSYYQTMGVDRIFACEAVQNSIIIDAGSAITVDIVRDGVFEGGFIYPGTKAMSQTYRDISPALEYEFNFNLNLHTLPKNSQDAISYGYLKTLHSEVISHKLPILLTGGDAQKLSSIFPTATLDEMIIFKGMKKIISLNFELDLDKMRKL